jgi:cytidylate kinase
MGIITISRKTGSFGTFIGQNVADKLGMKCVGKDFLAQIMNEYGFSKFNEIYNATPNTWEIYDEMRVKTLSFMVKTIEAIGHHGNLVLVGRGGFEIFEDYCDVLNVRTNASLDVRIKRKQEQGGFSEDEAKERVANHDRARKAFLQSELQHGYNNTQNFDLVINTGIVDIEYAGDLIASAYKNLMERGRNVSSKKLNDLKIDPVLEKLIEEKVKQL